MATAATARATSLDSLNETLGAENKALVNYADAVWVSTRKMNSTTGAAINDSQDVGGVVGMKLVISRGSDNRWARWLRLNGARQIFEPHNAHDGLEEIAVSGNDPELSNAVSGDPEDFDPDDLMRVSAQ